MENRSLAIQHNHADTVDVTSESSSEKAFIKGNSISATLEEIKAEHVIPVFLKDNEPVISHTDFIESMVEVATHIYGSGSISKPVVRISHPIMGRVPEARNKPAAELMEWEKTRFYERMMFAIEVPTIHDEVAGNSLSLTIGGVKAYNIDNLNNKIGADQNFKIYAGFKNTVCTNLCVSADGYVGDLKVKNIQQLYDAIFTLLQTYNAVEHLRKMQYLTEYSLTEHQFAQLIGRCRMYPYLTQKQRDGITPLLFGDQQVNNVCRDYYRDRSFCKSNDGSISLWRLYNLFTGANKSTYIDQFLDRSVNAYQLAGDLKQALISGRSSWYFLT